MMFKTISEKLRFAEELLAAKKFKDMVEALGEIEYDSISPQEKALCNLLKVEANMSLGNYDIDKELRDALLFYKSSRDNVKFAQAKHLQGWLLMVRGKHLDAREVLLESSIIYGRYDQEDDQARVLNRLGFLCFRLGDIDAAEQYIKKCIGIYAELRNTVKQLTVSINLGLVYGRAGYLRKAIEIYGLVDKQKSLLSKKNRSSFNLQYAIPLALTGKLKSARDKLEAAKEECENFINNQVLYLDYMGWFLALEGRFSEAKEYQIKAVELAEEKLKAPLQAAQAKLRLADALIGLGRDNEALQLTEEVLEQVSECNERSQIAACYRNLGMIDAGRGNPVKAAHWFKKALQIFSIIKSGYDIALTRYIAASSGAIPNGEKQACLYLAREYFEKEGVKGFVARINTELNGVPTSPYPTHEREQVRPPRIFTVDGEMKRLISMAEHVASSDMSVLLTGATGTGKDLFARYIHNYSGRSGRFVSINAAAIPDSMVESELFGHRRGAFTNADRDKTGLIEVANNGTLYLNEIADSSKELQAKLLDVLENHKIRRLGETKERQVAFRLVAATNHDLAKLVDEGRFRIDLYHRLSEVSLSLMPLSERIDDIRVLLREFLAAAGVVVDNDSPEFDRLVETLMRRDWPGNVRQLEAESKRLALLSSGKVEDMLKFVSQPKPNERDHLLSLLQQTGWNRREVARRLNVSDTTIRRKINKFKLDK